MPKLYDNLLAPEWRIAIEPPDLADNVLRSMRILTGRLAALTTLDLSADTIRPYYSTLNVNVNDIEYVNAVASDELPLTAGELTAGMISAEQLIGLPKRVGKYRFPSDTAEVDAFGVGIVDNIALAGRDFE